MTGAGVKCVECGGEYEATDEPDTYRCRACGHLLRQSTYVKETAERLREYDEFRDVADWLDERAERLAEVKNGA